MNIVYSKPNSNADRSKAMWRAREQEKKSIFCYGKTMWGTCLGAVDLRTLPGTTYVFLSTA